MADIYFAANVGYAELAGPFPTEGEARRAGAAMGFGRLVLIKGTEDDAYPAAVAAARHEAEGKGR